MPLSWEETWQEHTLAAGRRQDRRRQPAVDAAAERQPTVEDLKAIRLRLWSAIVEIDREIAAGGARA